MTGGNPAGWRAFARFVYEHALDPEMYGEAINADPHLLEPMFSAFCAAWERP